MAERKPQPILDLIPTPKPTEKILSRIEKRRSKQLIFAFCGPVGSAVKIIVDDAKDVLNRNYNYEAVNIKISDFIKRYADKTDIKLDLSDFENPKK